MERRIASSPLEIALLRVLNKQDRVDTVTVRKLTRTLDAVAISANDGRTLCPLLDKMEVHIRRVMRRNSCAGPAKPVVAAS